MRKKLVKCTLESFVVLAALTALPALADETSCPDRSESSGSIQAQSIQMRDRCLVMVSPSGHGDSYRSYSFSSTGGFQVFNAFGDGPISRTTGARYYFLFPRGGTPSFDVMTTGDIEVRLASGQLARISSSDARVQSISGATFREDPNVSARNNGGLDILSSSTLVLDCGFRVGEAPYASVSRSSVFRDPRGKTCQVSNREIFDYSGEPALRFATDADLAAFLANRCPQLDTSSLVRPAVSQPALQPIAPDSGNGTPSAGSAG